MRAATITLLACTLLTAAACGRVSLDLGGVASDAGLGGLPPPDGGAGAPDTSDAGETSCLVASNSFALQPPEILVVLDRSATDRPAWRSDIATFAGVVRSNNFFFDWGLYTFPDDGPACEAGTVSSTVDVPFAPMNAPAVASAMTATTPDGNASPTAAAIRAATTYLRTVTDPNAKLLMLATDGAPDCAGFVMTEIAAAKLVGFSTVVVGLSPSTPADVSALNDMAVAGGYARSQGDVKFYVPSNLSELFTLTTTSTSCTFNLFRDDPPPAAPDAVRITFNDQTVPRDRAHIDGWDYVDAQMRLVELFGPWCDQVQSSRSGKIDAYAPCP
jgi:hypothetical protein